MMDVLRALILGFLFGWALNKAGLTHYSKIVNVYRFKDLTVMRFMLSALAVAAVLIQLGLTLGLAETLTIPPTSMMANLIGGVIFGVGMATAGYCPGTVVAEAGEGRMDAWIAGFSGLVVGAICFGLLYPMLMPALAKHGFLGRITLADLMGANPWLVVVIFVQIVILVLLAISKVGNAPGQESVCNEKP